MVQVCIVYHSGYGHTKVQAEAVAKGAKSVLDTAVHIIPVQDVE